MNQHMHFIEELRVACKACGSPMDFDYRMDAAYAQHPDTPLEQPCPNSGRAFKLICFKVNYIRFKEADNDAVPSQV